MSEPLLTRFRRLRVEVAGHKSALNHHRKALRVAAAELEAVIAECRDQGIDIITVPATGTGDIHSHADRPS